MVWRRHKVFNYQNECRGSDRTFSFQSPTSSSSGRACATEPWAIITKSPQRSLLGSRTISAGNGVQPLVDHPRPQLAQYEPSCHSLGSNADVFHPIIAVFKLPDEIILSIPSHVSPGPWLAGHHTRFCIPYCVGNNDCHNRRVQFLRPFSMTCRVMRLRLLPWVWVCVCVWGGLEASPWLLQTMRKFNPIVLNAFRADAVLATSAKCVCTLLCLLNGAN